MSATAIEAIREICSNCQPTSTDKFVGNQRLYARHLNVQQSNAVRRGVLSASQMGSENLFVVYRNAVDGAEFKWEEIVPAIVQSRSTGGLSKFECGFDPQPLKVKNHLKRQYTEMMYIHREECMVKYIGSTFQDPMGGPQYIMDNDSLGAIKENTDIMVDLFVQDARAVAKAVDGTSILGNFTGYEKTGVTGNGISSYPHFDGILKQVSQNANHAFYATVDVTIPTIGGGAVFVKHYGTWLGSDTDVAGVVDLINAGVVETGETLYSAYDAGTNVIRITANNMEQEAYGEGALQIYYSATGTIDDCDDPLSATIIENPMAYAEESLLFDYSTAVSISNFYDYFKDVIIGWKKHVIRLSENGRDLFGGEQPYIAIDPLLLVDYEFAKIQEVCSCYDNEGKTSFLDSVFPRFVGVKALEGTGLWFMSYASNIIFLTNQDATQPQLRVWHDMDCDKVKSRVEMLGNVIILDFAAVATNVVGSPFESTLRASYQPEQLPHLTPEVRQDAISNYPNYASYAAAKVTVEDTGADTNDVTLTDTTFLGDDGLTVASRDWTVYISTGAGTVQPATETSPVVTEFSDAELAAIVMIELEVTFSDGSTDVVNIPASEFITV